MINRFQGDGGRARLIDVLLDSQLVKNDKGLAELLAESGKLVEFSKDGVIILQEEADNDVYFILHGEVNVLVNGRHVAVRKPGDAIGEMSVLEPTEARSATVIAITKKVVALKIAETDFKKIADNNLTFWKRLATTGFSRLRQRNKVLDFPNDQPLLFIGCSVEGLTIAEEIQLKLKHADISVVIWTDGIFTNSSITLDQLQDIANQSDFAAFIFTKDDAVISRETEYKAPRDNVVFELGLFLGKLDRARIFIIHEHKSDIKIPSDLLGVTPITYSLKKQENLTVSIAPVCTEIKKTVSKFGAR